MKLKNTVHVLLLAALANNVHAQGFLKKLKDKVVNKAESNTAAAATGAAPSSSKTAFADPAKYGKVIVELTDKQIAGAPDGFIMFFQSATVNGTDITAKVNFSGAVYNYAGGQFQPTTENPAPGYADIFNASEKDRRSIDMTQTDMMATMMKTGPHIASGTAPGKINQDLTFAGKKFASYAQFSIIRNYDSTAVAAAGAFFGSGSVAYSLTNGNGQTVKVPMQQILLLSRDGSIAGNLVQAAIIKDNPSISAEMKASGAYIYLSNGKTISMANYGDANSSMWLSNSGNVFTVDNADQKTVKRNDTALFTSDAPIDMKQFFMGADDKNWAWVGARDLHFSDGTVFPEVFNAYRVYVNGKDVILFLTRKNKQVLLCQKEL